MDLQNVKNITIPEGSVNNIHDKDGKLLWGRLAYDTKYAGDILQNGTPTPDIPVPVQIVSGEQTVQITAGTESEDFTVNLGTTELCKIGDYQDYIYKSGDDWYVHYSIGKAVFNGEEGWFAQSTYAFGLNYDNVKTTASGTVASMVSTYYPAITPAQLQTNDYGVSSSSSASRIFVRNKDITTRDNFLTLLSSHNLTLYFALATSTDTKITDNTLIGQLNAIHKWLTRYGYSPSVTGNLPIIINQTNLQV